MQNFRIKGPIVNFLTGKNNFCGSLIEHLESAGEISKRVADAQAGQSGKTPAKKPTDPWLPDLLSGCA